MTRLTHRVAVYVPSTIDVDRPADTQAWVDRALHFLASQYGGATSHEALGAWLSQEGTLVQERVTICFAYAASVHEAPILEFAENLRRELRQEAVAVEIDGELLLVA